MKLMVIGASRGLGRAFVEGLCSAGDTVIGVSRNRPRDIECPEGVTLQWIEADLSQPTVAADHIAAQAPADLDVLIHNLGIWEQTAFSDEYAFLDETDAALTQLVDVNITATLVLLQRLLPRVLGAPRPQLVLTGSTSALPRSGRPEVAFGASKFALNGIADALREGFRDRRLAVTSLQLGYLNTDDALSVPVAEAAARGDGELVPVHDVVAMVRALLQLSPSGFVRELVLPAIADPRYDHACAGQARTLRATGTRARWRSARSPSRGQTAGHGRTPCMPGPAPFSKRRAMPPPLRQGRPWTTCARRHGRRRRPPSPYSRQCGMRA